MEKRALGRGLAALIPEKQTADNIQMLSSKSDDGGQPAMGTSTQVSAPTTSEFTPDVDFAPGTEASDDLPF